MISALLSAALLLGGCQNVQQSASGESSSQPDVTETQAATTAPGTDVPDEESWLDHVTVPDGYGAVSTLCLKDLPDTHAVQQFAFYRDAASKRTYVFVTQRSGTNTYLSRCLVDEKTHTAVQIDYTVLVGYGHGDILDVTVHNGEVYLMVGSDANVGVKADGTAVTKDNWSTTITRLKYNTGEIEEIKKITDIHYASKDGSILREDGVPYRVNLGMDDEADVLAVYVSVATASNPSKVTGYHHITAYRLSALHDLLDQAQESISLKNCTDAFLATTGSVGFTKIFQNSSCQGIDVDANGNIYVTGGSTSNKPQLGLLKTEGERITRAEVKDIEFLVSEWLRICDFRETDRYVEIESIKYFNGAYYCVFNPGGDMRQNYTEIYLLGDHQAKS